MRDFPHDYGTVDTYECVTSDYQNGFMKWASQIMKTLKICRTAFIPVQLIMPEARNTDPSLEDRAGLLVVLQNKECKGTLFH